MVEVFIPKVVAKYDDGAPRGHSRLLWQKSAPQKRLDVHHREKIVADNHTCPSLGDFGHGLGETENRGPKSNHALK